MSSLFKCLVCIEEPSHPGLESSGGSKCHLSGYKINMPLLFALDTARDKINMPSLFALDTARDKTNKMRCGQPWLRAGWILTSTRSDQIFNSARCENLRATGFFMKQSLIRLNGCLGWSERSLGTRIVPAHTLYSYFCSNELLGSYCSCK